MEHTKRCKARPLFRRKSSLTTRLCVRPDYWCIRRRRHRTQRSRRKKFGLLALLCVTTRPVDPTCDGARRTTGYHTPTSSTSISIPGRTLSPLSQRSWREERPPRPTIVIHSNRTGIASNSTRLQAKRNGRECRLLQLSFGAMMVSATPPPWFSLSRGVHWPATGPRVSRTSENERQRRAKTCPRSTGLFYETIEMVQGWWRSSRVGNRGYPPRRRLTDSEADKDGSLSRFVALLPCTPLLLPGHDGGNTFHAVEPQPRRA